METFLVVLCLFLLPVLFCLSLIDISLRSVNYYKISSIHRHGNRKAEKLFSLLSSPERAVAVLLFSRYTLTAFLFLIVGVFLNELPVAAVYKFLLAPAITLFLLVLLEYIPRMLAVQNPERIAFTLLKPFEWVLKLNMYLPVPQLCERLASRLLRVYGVNVEKIFSQYSVNEIKMFLSLRRTKSESDLQKQTIDYKFFEFSGILVREVMVPRPFVKAVEVNTPLPNLLKAVREHGYSRMPVYRNNFDNVLGILYTKDIIGAAEPFFLEHHLRKPFFIPETATAQKAFQNMQRNHVYMALVVDEYGGIDGIVTLEDLIEELMGEIHDEYDEEVEMLHKVTESSWLLEGNLPLKELNSNLSLDLPEDRSYTTVAGFLLSILDKIPVEKEQIRYGDYLFSIEKMAGNKISKVALRLPQPVKDPNAG